MRIGSPSATFAIVGDMFRDSFFFFPSRFASTDAASTAITTATTAARTHDRGQKVLAIVVNFQRWRGKLMDPRDPFLKIGCWSSRCTVSIDRTIIATTQRPAQHEDVLFHRRGGRGRGVVGLACDGSASDIHGGRRLYHPPSERPNRCVIACVVCDVRVLNRCI